MPLVSSSIHDYSYVVGDHIREFAQRLDSNTFVIVDDNISRLYRDLPFLGHFYSGRTVICASSEAEKEYFKVGQTIDQLLCLGIKRNSLLVGIGGGVVQDITCFIAQILFRGIRWAFIPTTFLAQADSCIGSKSSINLSGSKNQIGGFYPPTEIIIDPSFLETLPDSDYLSGLGEISHYFLLDSTSSFNRFKGLLSNLLIRSKPAVEEAISCSLAIKHQMIEIDEFDKGPRLVFNYGHSFGHAIEACTDHEVPHGIAVVFGMLIANSLSVHLLKLSGSEAQRMEEVLKLILDKYGEVCLPSPDQIVEKLCTDKKNRPGEFAIVLSYGIGQMKLEYLDRSLYAVKIADAIRQVFRQY